MQAVFTNKVVVPVASAKQVAPVQAKAVAPARVAAVPRAFSNAKSSKQMLVWEPTNNKFFETLSYLPPLSTDQIARQIDYIVSNGWTPCLEFSDADGAYVKSTNVVRFNNMSPGYYDNRYWSMYKLPMFGCTDPGQVLNEIDNATRAFPDAYIRICGFDSIRQTQCVSFLVHRPPSANDYRDPNERSR
uniref:Ribulose bisphosphate carboxylase small subunit, chloroplastic n=1 Tax=Araucaria cunninghamii TaxID=56994 RepID=A0A0D6R8I3_ARACU